MSKYKYKIIFLAILILFTSTIYGCANSTDDVEVSPTVKPIATPVAEVVPYAQKLDLLIMPPIASSAEIALSSSNKTIKYLEDKYNVVFDFINTSSDTTKTYGEMLTSYITSGIIPDYMNLDILGADSASYKKLVDSGVAINIGSYIKDNPTSYPMLTQYIIDSPYIVDYTLNNYKQYSLPNYKGPDSTVYLVRGDWVVKAGYELSDINTLEKFAELMNVFVEEDFDGQKTDGFSTGAEKYLHPIFAGYTGSYMFKEVDGYYTDWYTLYEFREALGYLHLMYETGAFDNDYLVHDGAVSKEKIATGKAGCVATDISNLPMLELALKENYPDAYLQPLPVDIMGSGGSCRITGSPLSTAVVISSYFEDPARMLDMFEFLFSEKGSDIISFGIENEHYNMNGSDIVPNYSVYSTEGWKYNEDGTSNINQSYNEIRNLIMQTNVLSPNMYSQNSIDWYSSLLGYSSFYTNPFADNGYNPTSSLSAFSAVKDKWIDKFISGKKSLSDKNWDAFIVEYLEAGAQAQMDFYNK